MREINFPLVSYIVSCVTPLSVQLLTLPRRIAQGVAGQQSNKPITLLKDEDQPFVYDVKFFNRPYRFELCDTASLTNWKLLRPDVVVICFDISQRLSLIDVQRYVSLDPHSAFSC